MSLLRLAYAALFLFALVSMLFVWSEVGGADHFDLTPWFLKLVLGAGAAFAIVKATAAAVAGERAWNGGTLKWCGILLAILIACGLATLWVHRTQESEESGDEEPARTAIGALAGPAAAVRAR